MAQRRYAVALGSFDGLHRGHRAVLDLALSLKNIGLIPCALVFDEHPLRVVGTGAPPELMTVQMRDGMLEDLGIKVRKISFARIADMSAHEFFDEVLVGELSAGAVCCGYNYRFAKNAAAGTDELKALCLQNGIECAVAPKTEYAGSAISSTRIRKALSDGNIEDANAMLGRCFSYCFTVVSGDRRGRLIGAPTINQHFPEGFIVPKFGVYASAVPIDGELHAAVTNIGRRPSFTCNDLRSETCITGFAGDLYGRDVEVKLLKYIRPERVFNSLDELGDQIAADAEEAKKIFEKMSDIK